MRPFFSDKPLRLPTPAYVRSFARSPSRSEERVSRQAMRRRSLLSLVSFAVSSVVVLVAPQVARAERVRRTLEPEVVEETADAKAEAVEDGLDIEWTRG